MASYSSLSRLVNKLNKAEKREFSRSLGLQEQQDAYFWVYRHLQAHPDNLKRLQKDFEGSFPGGALSMAMNHLYTRLLNFLVIQDRNKDAESSVLHSMLQIKTLYARGMYEECFQLTVKTRELCSKYEFYQWLYLLNRLELMLRMSTRYFHLEEAELVHLHAEIGKMLNYLQTQSRHQQQYDLLRLRRGKMRKAEELPSGYALDDLAMLEQQTFSIPRYSSFEAEMLHLMFQSEYFLARGKLAACQRIFQTLDQHFEQHPQQIQHFRQHYLAHMSGMLQAAYQAGDFQAMAPYLLRLDQWANDHRDDHRDTAILAPCISLHYKILKSLKENEFDKALEFAQEAALLLTKALAPSTLEAARLLRLSAGIAFLVNGDYRKSGSYFTDCYSRDISVNLSPVIYTAHLLTILSYFRRGEDGLMAAEIRSFQRSLRKYHPLGDKESNLFELLKNNHLNQDQFRRQLHTLVHDESSDPNELMNHSKIFFDWPAWLAKHMPKN